MDMLTAAKLSEAAGVPVYTVRHYTRIELLRPTRDPQNGYRLYRESDVDRLRFVVSAKQLGFTLNEIDQILHSASQGDSPCPMVREIVERRIVENKEKIKELKNLQRRLEHATAVWRQMNNGFPNGHSVCRLIEAVSEGIKSA